MPLDAIKIVSETEQLALQRKKEAKAAGKKLLSDAERAGQALLDCAESEAAAAVRSLLLEAEQKAEADAGDKLIQSDEACAALLRQARENLDRAAALIVERVVRF